MINTLPSDYLLNARHFLFVTQKACSVIPSDSIERIITAAGPLNFMLGHASELLLKSALAFKGYDEKTLTNQSLRHDLSALKEACQKEQIPLLEKFVFWIDVIAENHKAYDFRYFRSFGGFPEGEYERLLSLIGKQDSEAKKELRKYGLVTTSPSNIDDFILAIEEQIKIIVNLDQSAKQEDKV